MTLDAYLERAGAMSLTAISIGAGVSKGRLSQLRHSTEWPPELAMKVEAVTSGALDASKLSPIIAQARGIAA